MGLETFIGNYTYNFFNIDINFIPVFIGVILLLIVGNGNYKIFEKFLVFLVSMMSLTFIFIAIISKPNFSDLLNGLVPSVNDKNFVYVIGLIGTTVVPYNLFLHSYVSKNKWKTKEDHKIYI